MEHFFTEQAIGAATLVGFLVGAVWYSPLLFMKAWLIGEGLTKETNPKRSLLYLAQTNFYSFIAHGCIASVVALIFDLVGVSSLQVALSIGALLTIGLIVSSRFIDMVYSTKGVHYDRKNQLKFLVVSGYYIVTVLAMSATLFFVAQG